MMRRHVDLLVIGGGVNGAAVARDAAGRGMKVMLAERDDYASATSSGSSNLIHGGLRYLETFEFGLVRESLRERENLLHAAPYLVRPLRFLVPLSADQRRPGWQMWLGLKLYDFLSGSSSLPRSGRLSRAETATIPRLRGDALRAVLHYHDCQTDDARLVMALLLDARERGADIANRREVIALKGIQQGFGVTLRENGRRRDVTARFVVNAAGPWADRLDAMAKGRSQRCLRLVRGSHIVLKMPRPATADAFTLQMPDGRIVFVMPWLGARYLVIGTTDLPHDGDAADACCTTEERDYLLAAYNRYFTHARGKAAPRDIVWSWSAVRPLVDDGSGDPSKVSRSADITSRRQGKGGLVSVWGGKLTTHRALAEEVIAALGGMGASIGNPWTHGATLPGGGASLEDLAREVVRGPSSVPVSARRRWADSYGDRIGLLYARIGRNPREARLVAWGIPEAELHYARDSEDARTAEDFLLRRSKLHLSLDRAGRAKIARWFAL
ncbi:MAG: glycerol-3-phosphate dehydrogenase [Pseudomonadota bacterium]|nr:glycerol-3-phosphate dehydrogenase [Pseudomonadota bacterium]